MSGFQIQIRGLDQIAPELRAIAEQGETLGLEKLAILIQKFVSDNWPVGATGMGTARVTHVMQGAKAAVIFEGAPADVYAAPVETGARPHMPPASALLLWVKVKLGISEEKKALSVAFAIAKTIARRGTAAHHQFERSLGQVEPLVQGVMERAIAEAIQNAGAA